MTLADALTSCLSTGFPGSQNTISLNSGLVRPNDEVGFFPTLEQLAQFCRQTSFDIIKTSGYAGVSIVPVQNGFSIFDGSSAAPGTVAISFQDLIGQPTWIEAPNISAKAVMRADLQVGTPITLPPTQITNTAAAATSIVNQNATFQGGFDIISLRHVGRYRQPSADSWCTVIEAAPSQPVQ
jgi:hypothetical protein